MPYYADLNPDGALGAEWAKDVDARRRAVERLLRLRGVFRAGEAPGTPPPRAMNSLLLATWNLREFDSSSWGARLPESYAYLAEVMARFDLIAVQEIRADLAALDRLRRRLGPHWSYLVSDVTAGSAGNQERLGFLYDQRKVRFLGIAGELVLPPVRSGSDTKPSSQVARTPLMAAFQVGWTKFVLATVHILYGEDSAEPEARIEEIEQVAGFLRKRTESKSESIRNIIALGDFNIFSKSDRTMKALTEKGGFSVPEGLQSIPGSNVRQDKWYDQIAFRARQGHFEATGRAGVFDFFDHVFTDDDERIYRPYIDDYIAARHTAGSKSPKQPKTDRGRATQYRTWRTHQLSDHLPMWAEFRTDFSTEYLEAVADG